MFGLAVESVSDADDVAEFVRFTSPRFAVVVGAACLGGFDGDSTGPAERIELLLLVERTF